MDGFETLEKLKAAHRGLAAIMFSGSAMPQDIDRARKLGACGFLSKDIDCLQLCSAIVNVWNGGQHWPARATDAIRGRELSERERQVLEAIRRGLSNADIGRALSISEHTVKSHVKKLLKKLDAADRAEAVARGFEEGLLR
jgi:DNA-binding NarL/FixJ family response regulator